MAKADFCFTYYDGDAARDMAHMNRLERGAYSDIIISQRKFGHLTLDQIKKILGKDFAECWPAIELVMKQAEGKFFIEWLQTSESKAKKHSKYQSDKRKGKTKKNQTQTESQPPKSQQQPLGDGNGDEDGKGRGKGKGDGAALDLVFPYDTPRFREVWDAWRLYRKEIKKPYRSTLSEQAALKGLERYGEDTAIQMIEQSVANSWQGIFPINEQRNGKSTNHSHPVNASVTDFAKRVSAKSTGEQVRPDPGPG